MMDFVKWDYDIPKIWKVVNFHGSSHQKSAEISDISAKSHLSKGTKTSMGTEAGFWNDSSTKVTKQI
jgi:hypothetical protein